MKGHGERDYADSVRPATLWLPLGGAKFAKAMTSVYTCLAAGIRGRRLLPGAGPGFDKRGSRSLTERLTRV